ncbi:MAG TPA: hypothetical protein VHC95_13245 [Opitutales bacterium]|nr:hypothetical protein [Opitutales bacterium]
MRSFTAIVGLMLAALACAADAPPPRLVHLGASEAQIIAVLGVPTSYASTKNRTVLTYPEGQIVLEDGKATDIPTSLTDKPPSADKAVSEVSVPTKLYPVDQRFRDAFQKMVQTGYMLPAEMDAMLRSLVKMDTAQQAEYMNKMIPALLARIKQVDAQRAQVAQQQAQQQRQQQQAAQQQQQAAYQRNMMLLSYSQLLTQQQQLQEVQSWRQQQAAQQQQQQFQDFIYRTTPHDYFVIGPGIAPTTVTVTNMGP